MLKIILFLAIRASATKNKYLCRIILSGTVQRSSNRVIYIAFLQQVHVELSASNYLLSKLLQTKKIYHMSKVKRNKLFVCFGVANKTTGFIYK